MKKMTLTLATATLATLATAMISFPSFAAEETFPTGYIAVEEYEEYTPEKGADRDDEIELIDIELEIPEIPEVEEPEVEVPEVPEEPVVEEPEIPEEPETEEPEIPEIEEPEVEVPEEPETPVAPPVVNLVPETPVVEEPEIPAEEVPVVTTTAVEDDTEVLGDLIEVPETADFSVLRQGIWIAAMAVVVIRILKKIRKAF